MIHRLPALAPGQRAACVRCSATVSRFEGGRTAAARTAAWALSAFILYWPAVLLPILDIERLGHHHRSSLLFGSIDLLLHESWFVGVIVIAFSIVFPLVKIVLLLELSWLGMLDRRHKAVTYRLMEFAGRWSMMDVLLLAFLVMLVELDGLVMFQLGPAVLAFVSCVVMSMLASLSFDPHSIWEQDA